MKHFVNICFTLLSLCFYSFSYAQSGTEIEDEKIYSQAELEQLLAPVALYPDSILTHILIASTYPLEVVQAERWIRKQDEIDSDEALKRVEKKDWDPSVKALVAFPDILKRMSEDLDWTQDLGDAFLQDEERMLAHIQSLRKQAKVAGNLDKIDNMEIVEEDEHIIIQPADPKVIYVPYYDPRVVYGSWRWRHYPPYYWDWTYHHHYHYRPHVSLFAWYPRVHLSHHFFWGAFHWQHRHVVVLNHRHRYLPRRSIIRHHQTRRWVHNPVSRRGVAYRTHRVHKRYYGTKPARIKRASTYKKDHIVTHKKIRQGLKGSSSKKIGTYKNPSHAKIKHSNKTRHHKAKSSKSYKAEKSRATKQRSNKTNTQRKHQKSHKSKQSTKYHSTKRNHSYKKTSRNHKSNKRSTKKKVAYQYSHQKKYKKRTTKYKKSSRKTYNKRTAKVKSSKRYKKHSRVAKRHGRSNQRRKG